MRFRFKTKRLEALYYEGKGTKKYPEGVVDAFFEVMAYIENAVDERELRGFKGLHFEQLRGKRAKLGHQSIRLNDQYRLILTIRRDQDGKYLLIIRLAKHYR